MDDNQISPIVVGEKLLSFLNVAGSSFDLSSSVDILAV